LNRGPGWEVVTVSGDGTALVNGHPVALAQTEDVARAIRAGGRVTLPAGSSLVLAAPGRMVVEITPETETSLSAPPARWLGRIASAQLTTGEIRVTTGARFHGSKLFVKTPEAAIEVTGTTLAVIREPQGTCVCVMEGEVRVGAPGDSMVPVVAGRRRYLFRDGREPEQAEMRPVEKEKLAEMRHEHAERMGADH
jgi:ferric-dicitrate binding protein FerR (iron transport regulator)